MSLKKTLSKAPSKVGQTKKVIDAKSNSDIVTSKKGLSYKITGEGTVKKVKSLMELPNIVDMEKLNNQKQLEVISAFLRDKGQDVVVKNKMIFCRDYKMYFTIMGFTIYDMKNYGKKCQDFNVPMPTPREVWEFISKTNSEDAKRINDMAQKMIEKKNAEKQKIRDLKEQSKKQSDIVEKPIVKSTDDRITIEHLEECRKKTLRMIKQSKKVRNVVEKMKTAIPHRGFVVLYNKIYRKFKNREIRSNKYLSQVVELLTTIDFTPKREPAPKFTGTSFPIVVTIKRNSDSITYTDTNKINKTISITEYFCRYLLVEDTRFMPQLMKLLKNEIDAQSFIECPIKKDIFEEFNFKLMINNNEEVNKALIKLFKNEGIINPMNFVYSNEVSLKVGDKIVVQFKDYGSEATAKVISLDGGIEIRDEDGDAYKLLNHQEIEKIN